MEKITSFFITLLVIISCSTWLSANERIPFYEDYLESGNFDEYLKKAHQFLDENPKADEAPRLALDLIMMGKAAEDLPSIVRGTDLLLFDYLGSLPSLHFISSFDKGSERLTKLLMVKTEEADLSSNDFAQSYADALTLLSRIHGPTLLADSSLRLRSYLIIKNSENSDLTNSLKESFIPVIEKKASIAPLVLICQSEQAPLDKIKSLYLSSHPQTDFCLKYYLAQLSDEEKNTTKFKELMVNLNLFGVEPKPQLVLSYIGQLPQELSNSLKYQVYTALAHLLDGNTEDPLTLLSGLYQSENKNDSQWDKIARSLKDGFEFGENRKKLLLEHLEKGFKRLEEDSEFPATYIQGTWSSANEENNLQFYIGVNKEENLFEIHLQKNEKPFFAYRMDINGCLLYTPDKKLYNFKQGGAYPLPSVEIKRDPESGTFNYSFNLNFSRSFSDFLSQVSTNMDNSYLGTSKGREVLLSHFLNRKGFWFSAPASSKEGTVFSLHKLSSESELLNYKLEIAFSGAIVSLNLGKLNVDQFLQDKADILSNLPAWKNENVIQESEFDLSKLLESIGTLMGK